ncbi:MAG: hypothetical protein IPK71_26285 [Myxococcales bacterium]|nr:hypothetical protein [Myxococcales bacterium]
MNRLAIVAALVTVSATGLAGCTSETTPPEPDQDEVAEIQAALARDGGLGTGDEAPDFADPDVSGLADFEERFADPAGALPAPPAAARTFRLMLVWGHLPKAQDAAEAQTIPQKIDWSGTVSVDAGVVGVSRTLKFDDKDAVATRTDPKVVSFTSRTYPAVDGLLLRIAVPQNAMTLHVRTNALTTDIDLSTLARDAGGVAPLGDGRNGLAWIGYPDAPGCTNGFVLGHWSKLAPGVGKLKASVLDDSGQRIGRAKGIWGYAKAKDKNVFFGKFIANEGAHRGLFGGTYGDGALQGAWGNRQTNEGGGLRGFYSDGYDKTDAKGVWVGRYTEPCAR